MVKQLNSPFKIRNQTRISYIITNVLSDNVLSEGVRIGRDQTEFLFTNDKLWLQKAKCQQLKTMPKRLRLKIYRISMQMADEIRTQLKNKDRQTEVLRQQNKPGPPFHPWSSRRGRGGRAVLSAVVHVHTPWMTCLVLELCQWEQKDASGEKARSWTQTLKEWERNA